MRTASAPSNLSAVSRPLRKPYCRNCANEASCERTDRLNFVESLVYGITGGIGFTVAILLFSSVRERLEDCDCPKAFRGFPIALLAAGLLALSFMGFSGFKVFG